MHGHTTALTMALLFPLACLAACSKAPAGGPAARCAQAVQVYKGLQSPVGVVNRPVQTSEGSVQIEYEGMDPFNLPVKGSATCTFEVGEAGALTLVDLYVDGSQLGAADLDSIRAQLPQTQ